MMSPAGFEHGRLVSRITARLEDFVEQRGLGVVTGAETGFHIRHHPDTVRAPDVAFVRASRITRTPILGFFDGPPDLAVEVLSPDDRAREVLAKVHDWLDAGCLTVWVVDPSASTVAVYESGRPASIYGSSDNLSGGDILPGLSLPVAKIFAG